MSLSTTTRDPKSAIINILEADRAGIKDLSILFAHYRHRWDSFTLSKGFKEVIAETQARANLTRLSDMVSLFSEADLRESLKSEILARRSLTS